MNHQPAQLLAAATVAADEAAAFLRSQEGRLGERDWSLKGHADFVTEIDRESERMITASLTKAVPGSRVMGEELSPLAPSPQPQAPVLWIVDPLDGTTNYLHRFPLYAVSIAATVNGELLAGLVLHVPPGIHYTATRGGGAHRDGEPIEVSAVKDHANALIGTGTPYNNPKQWPRYHRQLEDVSLGAAGIRRPGSAALDLCFVASGRFDGFWELKLAPWDVAAGTLIVREAGGRVTDFDGNEDVLRGNPIVAGNPAIHSWLIQTLAHSP